MKKTQPHRHLRHVLLIAPPQSYRITPYINAAKQLDVRVTIASTGKHSLVSALAEGLHIDFADHQQALEIIRDFYAGDPFEAVIGSDDMGVDLASKVAGELGLAHNPPDAAMCTRRKDIARSVLEKAGVRVPAHRLLDLHQSLTAQLEALAYPCVMKPVAMSMSRGVIRVNNLKEARAACGRIEMILQDAVNVEERQYILVEDYIDGTEIAYEGLLNNGELQTLLLFDKPEPLTGPYFEETYYITPSRSPENLQQQVYATVKAACHAYGLKTGPVHAELRIDKEGRVWVMEVAARTIGGECARLVELASGQSLEQLVIANALSVLQALPKVEGAAGVLMIPTPAAGVLRRVEGLLDAQQVAGIKELVLSVREGHRLVPLPEGSSYLGFMYGVADTPEQVEQALREAHARIKIITAPLFEIRDQRVNK